MELEMYRRYSQMARGIEKAELVFKNGRVFSSGTGEFIDGDVAVADGIVIGAEGNRRKSRERMRKMREKRPGGCYDLPRPMA